MMLPLYRPTDIIKGLLRLINGYKEGFEKEAKTSRLSFYLRAMQETNKNIEDKLTETKIKQQ